MVLRPDESLEEPPGPPRKLSEKEDLVLGQINTLVALVAVLAILALNRGREALAGVLIAIAIVLKPYALILAPWLEQRRAEIEAVLAPLELPHIDR